MSFMNKKNIIKIFMVFTLIASSISLGLNAYGGNSEEKPIEMVSYANKLLNNKTDYNEDISKIVNLLDSIPIPDGIKREDITFQTSGVSNVIKFSYIINNYKKILDEDVIVVDQFRKNSIILLSLIDNVDIITYSFIDKDSNHPGAIYTFPFTREYANNEMGYDITEKTESADVFKDFLLKVENKCFEINQK